MNHKIIYYRWEHYNIVLKHPVIEITQHWNIIHTFDDAKWNAIGKIGGELNASCILCLYYVMSYEHGSKLLPHVFIMCS